VQQDQLVLEESQAQVVQQVPAAPLEEQELQAQLDRPEVLDRLGLVDQQEVLVQLDQKVKQEVQGPRDHLGKREEVEPLDQWVLPESLVQVEALDQLDLLVHLVERDQLDLSGVQEQLVHWVVLGQLALMEVLEVQGQLVLLD
jgi:hypothetical protein